MTVQDLNCVVILISLLTWMIRNSFNIALTQNKKGALSRYFDDVQNNLFIEETRK